MVYCVVFLTRDNKRFQNVTLKGRVVPVYTLKAYRRSRDVALAILNFGTRCTRVVSFTPRPLYPWVRVPVSIEWEQARHQSQYGRFGGKSLLLLPVSKPRTLQFVAY
jgi:hypothetical protein